MVNRILLTCCALWTSECEQLQPQYAQRQSLPLLTLGLHPRPPGPHPLHSLWRSNSSSSSSSAGGSTRQLGRRGGKNDADNEERDNNDDGDKEFTGARNVLAGSVDYDVYTYRERCMSCGCWRIELGSRRQQV